MEHMLRRAKLREMGFLLSCVKSAVPKCSNRGSKHVSHDLVSASLYLSLRHQAISSSGAALSRRMLSSLTENREASREPSYCVRVHEVVRVLSDTTATSATTCGQASCSNLSHSRLRPHQLSEFASSAPSSSRSMPAILSSRRLVLSNRDRCNWHKLDDRSNTPTVRSVHTATVKKGSENGFLELNTAGMDDVENGVRVALMAPPSREFVGGLFATWLSGGVVVPMALSHSKPELSYVMKDAGVSMIATTFDYLDTVAPLAEECSAKILLLPPMSPHAATKHFVDEMLTPGSGSGSSLNEPCIAFETQSRPGEELKVQPENVIRGIPAAGDTGPMDDMLGALVEAGIGKISSRMHGDSPALMIYTSGTTGRPKGVVHTHKGLISQVQCLVRAWEWSSDDSILHCLPLHHIHGLVNALLCPLFVGAAIEFLPKFDPVAVWDHWSASYPGEQNSKPKPTTVFMGVPTMYTKLLQAYDQMPIEEQERFAKGASKLRLMVSGSAPCPVSLIKKWQSVTGHSLLERYGMTEFGMALSNPLRDDRKPGFVGQPLPGVQVKIVQDIQEETGSNQQPQPSTSIDVAPVGELYVKSPGMFKEYWRQPEKTKDSFDDDGYFKTGDTVTVVSGLYKILGRTSVDIIKSGGYKISALEIESVLLEHRSIAECAVLGVSDPVYGEAVAAVVALKSVDDQLPQCSRYSTAPLELEELREWARQSLAPYKIPRLLRVIDFIPRNTLGKVNKKELLKLFSPASEP